MMPSKETKILFALLLILAALIVYRVTTKEEPKRVKDLRYKPGISRRQPAVGGQKPASQEGAGTERLKTEKRPYKGVIRNPFGSLYPPPPPRPRVIAKPVPPPVPVPAPFPVITAKGPSPAQIESGRIKFLGFLQKEGDRKIFLSKDKEIVIVKKGDKIGIFEVGDISDNSVTLIAMDTKEEFRLAIEDVKSTKPGILPGPGRR